ncbi:MAG TPA: DUF1345 domain-containing protein [Kineosporiaceae bacterium]
MTPVDAHGNDESEGTDGHRVHTVPVGEPAPALSGVPGSNPLVRYVTTAAEVALVGLAGLEVVAGTVEMVAIWAASALTYLAVGLAAVWYHADAPRAPVRTTGVLDALSWIPPIAASAAGVDAAVLVLARSSPDAHSQVPALVCSVGIIASWLLCHAGFADVYQGLQARSSALMFDFPGTPQPGYLEYLYFSFAVGTAFATSDTTVQTGRARLVVMVHSIAGFLYNAIVVAVAFQVLQSLVQQ